MAHLEELKQRYIELSHAMQSGVAIVMNHDMMPTLPKHLKVGVNSALVGQAAIAQLLMDKGIFTEEEYFQALCNQMEKEVKSYEEMIKDMIGGSIRLG